MKPGDRLGPYEIVSAIGEGGMGQVFKARDTRLERSVAIKVLPPDVSTDPDRRARFEREAKTIAGLNHPHICTLYDVGEHDGSTFLVMEHLSGDTLAQRLEKGPLPLEQALTVATEIADGLSAAHRQGVIHRDMKPGNVMLTKSGAKLLDFGLAKLKGHGEQEAAASLASAPTQTKPLTSEGAIVGTLQYMAPEQVEGKAADARTDLWALGAILYEMLTGKRAFEGTSAASLIGNIMNAEPAPVETLQPLTPPAVDRLVRQCLAKVPDDRPDTGHDVANDLRWLLGTSGVAALAATQPQRQRALRTALWAAAGLMLLATGAGVTWLLRPAQRPISPAGLSLDIRPAEEVNAGGVYPLGPTPGGSRTAITWTPDGQALVFVGRRGGVQQLYVRRLDAAEARPLASTHGAQVPAVSADGKWVAYWANGSITKVPIRGGPAMDLASGISGPPMGLVWGADGRLFYGYNFRIWAISADGVPAAVTTPTEVELSHVLPWPLPGGRAFLYTVRKRQWSWGDEAVVAQTLATGVPKVLLKDAADARYVPTGHLVFLRRGALYAVPFDVERLEVRGTPVAVLDTVAQALTAGNNNDVTGAGQFAIASTGTLVWVPSPVMPYGDSTLVTVDRSGQVSPLAAEPRSYVGGVRLSPDGRRLATSIRSQTEVSLWIYDLDRGTMKLLTAGGEASWPVWLPDGQHLIFRWLADGRRELASQLADGTAQPRSLLPGLFFPSSVAPDGPQVAVVTSPQYNIEVYAVENGRARLQPLIQARNAEGWPAFSRDGRWLAYASDISGRLEVYVRPYPGPGPTELISVEGGLAPAWNPNGRELFFPGLPDPADRRWMMAVEFTPGSPPRIGRPRPLFEFRDLAFGTSPVRGYDVSLNGQRFYVVQGRTTPPPPSTDSTGRSVGRVPATESAQQYAQLRSQPIRVTHINLTLNWFEELKAKAPVKR